MEMVIANFKERAEEVDRFLKVIGRLENPDVVHINRKTRRKVDLLKDGSLPVMKATIYLLIYNVVESSIRQGFARIYEEVKVSAHPCTQLSEQLQKIWIRQQLKIDKGNSSPSSFISIAEQLVASVLQEAAVNLDKNSLPLRGNLDARQIRHLCETHGVPTTVHHQARGGGMLKTVKDRRNGLAHGDESFRECGRDRTVQELEEIKKEAFNYVHSILRNIKRFIEKKQYAQTKGG